MSPPPWETHPEPGKKITRDVGPWGSPTGASPLHDWFPIDVPAWWFVFYGDIAYSRRVGGTVEYCEILGMNPFWVDEIEL